MATLIPATKEDDVPEKQEDGSSLRTVARLLALSLAEGKTQTEAIRLLARAGLPRSEIALVCGTNPDVVSVRLSEAKAKRKKKRP